MTDNRNVYGQLIEAIFREHYADGVTEFTFERAELPQVAEELGVDVPRNLGDVVYSFRYRQPLPESIRETEPDGLSWVIRPAGRGLYRFSLARLSQIEPTNGLAETKVPDATPGVISMYAFGDEQALLAIIRYNRLVDLFTQLTCYSLQNHLRTTIADLGQVETDEIYIGLDRRGVHYAIPIQAKGGTDILSVVQIEQDFAVCEEKFPTLVARPVAAQFMDGGLVALFEFELDQGGEVTITAEKHYRLVDPDGLDDKELLSYRTRPLE